MGCEPEPADTRLPIVDGTREMGEDAVVIIKVIGGVASCSGTFITDRVVLTAKHCVQFPDLEEALSPSLVSVGVGHDIATTTDYRARRVWATDGPFRNDGTLGTLIGKDIGLIEIAPRDGAFPDIEPIAIRRSDPEELVGQEVTFIGFGQRPDGGSGQKYKTTGTITNADPRVLYSSQNICQGDSGGPMILEGSPRTIVGVASFGQSAGCPSSRDGHNRIDTWLGLIDRAIYASGGCLPSGEETCNSIDDDCDGSFDEGCAALGDACGADDECADAQLPERFDPRGDPVTCRDVAGAMTCSRDCAPTLRSSCDAVPNAFTDTARATDGMYCARTEGCAGVCARADAGTVANGQACRTDDECLGLSCLDAGDGTPRCLQLCEGGRDHCASGEVCGATVDSCGACLPPSAVIGTRALGEPCTEPSECGSSVCTADGLVRYCSESCETLADCPEDFHCRGDACVRGPLGEVGEVCVSDDDCVGRVTCDAGVCFRECASDSDCGDETRFACVETRCEPRAATVGRSCMTDDECASGRCEDTICTRACGAAGTCPPGTQCARLDGELRCIIQTELMDETPDDGGCSVTQKTAPTSFAWALLVAAGLVVTRRGRR